MIIEYIPPCGTIVQVDCATGWVRLSENQTTANPLLKKLNIKIDLGRHYNPNINPIVDNACREFHKEYLKLKSTEGPLTEIVLSQVTLTMNQRPQQTGFTSKKYVFKETASLMKTKRSMIKR